MSFFCRCLIGGRLKKVIRSRAMSSTSHNRIILLPSSLQWSAAVCGSSGVSMFIVISDLKFRWFATNFPLRLPGTVKRSLRTLQSAGRLYREVFTFSLLFVTLSCKHGSQFYRRTAGTLQEREHSRSKEFFLPTKRAVSFWATQFPTQTLAKKALYCFQRSLPLPKVQRENTYLTKSGKTPVCGVGRKNIERNTAEFVVLE